MIWNIFLIYENSQWTFIYILTKFKNYQFALSSSFCFCLYQNIYLFIYLFIHCCSSIVVSIFIPPRPPPHTHPRILPFNLSPFGFVHVSFTHVPWWIFPYFLPLSPITPPLWLLSVCSLFHVSGYILLDCLIQYHLQYHQNNEIFMYKSKTNVTCMQKTIKH